MALFKRGEREAAVAAFGARLRFCERAGEGVCRAHRDMGVALLQCGQLAPARRELKAAARLQRHAAGGVEECLANDIQAIEAILRKQPRGGREHSPTAAAAAATTTNPATIPRARDMQRRHTTAAAGLAQRPQSQAKRRAAAPRRGTVLGAAAALPRPPATPATLPPTASPPTAGSAVGARRRHAPPVGPAQLDALKGKLLAAAYSMHGVDLAHLFAHYDTDGSGALELAELGPRLQKLLPGALSAEQLASLLRTVDRDGDGRVTLAEFIFFVNSRHGAPAIAYDATAAAGSPGGSPGDSPGGSTGGGTRGSPVPHYLQTTAASRRQSVQLGRTRSQSRSPARSPPSLRSQPRQQEEAWQAAVALAEAATQKKAEAVEAAAAAKAAAKAAKVARATSSSPEPLRPSSLQPPVQQHVKRPAWQLGYAAAVRAGDMVAAESMAAAGRRQEEELREENRLLEQLLEQQRQQLALQALQLEHLQKEHEQRQDEQRQRQGTRDTAGSGSSTDSSTDTAEPVAPWRGGQGEGGVEGEGEGEGASAEAEAEVEAGVEGATKLTEGQRALVALTLKGLPATAAAAATPLRRPGRGGANGGGGGGCSSSAALATEALGWLGAGQFSPMPAAVPQLLTPRAAGTPAVTVPPPAPPPLGEAEFQREYFADVATGEAAGAEAATSTVLSSAIGDFDRWAASQEAAMLSALDGWADATARAAAFL